MIYQRYFTEEFDAQGRLLDASLHYPETFNFAYDVLDSLAARQPDKLALLWRNDVGETRRFSFEDIRALSCQAANLFQHWGLQKGDVLTVCLRTRFEYWYLSMAAHRLGLVLSPIFHLLSQEDITYRLRASASKAVICLAQGETPGRIKTAARSLGIPLLYTVGGEVEGFQALEPLLAAQQTQFTPVKTQAQEAILLYFTSGTTGKPKGVLHNHAFLLGTVMGARYMQDNGPDSLHFATGNTAWEVICGTKLYGQWFCESAIFVYDYERFNPQQALQYLSELRVTSTMLQPTVYRQLTEVGMDKFDLSAVRCFAVGGEKLTRDLAKTVFAQTGQVLYEGYAQSEAGLIAANSKNMGRRENSVGKLLPKYHAELRRDDGSRAAPGESGELVLVAREDNPPVGLLMGYLGDEAASHALLQDGLFHTGDIMRQDEDGFLFFLGRRDGLIKTKGYRVSPFEIENSLSRHPAVYECLVVGEPDRALGQKICAYVQLREGFARDPVLEAALLRFHNERCSAFQKIRQLRIVSAFQRNANGKILREQFAAPPKQ